MNPSNNATRAHETAAFAICKPIYLDEEGIGFFFGSKV